MARPAPVSGILHTYRAFPPLTAFELVPSSPPSNNLLLLVGGLYDDLGTIGYLYRLAELNEVGWGAAQVKLSSSAVGWGQSSVATDAQEISLCVEYFKQNGKKKVVLIGQSTGSFLLCFEQRSVLMEENGIGCQDLITYFHHQPTLSSINGIILQAPVSDREILEHSLPNLPSILPHISESQKYVTPTVLSVIGTGEGPAVTTKRFKSLAQRPKGDEIDVEDSEDYFSSDLTDDRLKNVFKPVTVPLLMIMSGKDQYVPPHVKERMVELGDRFVKAAKSRSERGEETNLVIIEEANHQIDDEKDRDQLIQVLKAFLKEC